MKMKSEDTMRSRSFTLICCLMIGLMSGAGCVSRTPTPEPITISFVCAEQQEAFFQPLVETFRQTHRHIQIEFVRPERFGPARADVLSVSPFMRRFAQGQLDTIDLSSFIAQDTSFDLADLYPQALDMFSQTWITQENRVEIWAAPLMMDAMVMYYNKDLFDRYGVAYPKPDWTWDDFLRIGQALYDPDAGVFGYVPDVSLDDPLNFVYQNDGGVFDDPLNPTRTTFNDERTVEALDWYARLMYEYKAAASPRQARQAWGIGGYTLFGLEKKRLGMWTGMLSERGRWFERENWDFKWGMVPLPRGVRSATTGYVQGYAISAQAANPEACWQWISFLSRQPFYGGIPARRSLIASTAYQDQVGQDVAIVARMSAESLIMFSPGLFNLYDALRFYDQAVESIVEGSATAQEALNRAQMQSRFQ